MSSESNYLYVESSEHEGLGRIPPPTLNRGNPTFNKPTVRNRTITQPKRITLPKPTAKPRPLPKPRPVIDKNPIPTPAKLNPVSSKPAAKQPSNSKGNPTSTKKMRSTNQPAGASGGMLDGTFNLGGLQIKKKQAAVAGGAAVGGLLLWKLLF